MSVENFLEKVKKNYSKEDSMAIEYALNFATQAHKEQMRKTGEPYIIHPVEVADILIDLGLDPDTIIAALLHDVIEDTSVTQEDIKVKFGVGIAEMVEAVTKLTRININSTEDEQAIEQAENIKKLFFAMTKDIRVIMVKLADRLHNMRTMDALPPEKRIKKSRETLDIYAPLAGRMGISNMKCELEDLSMKYLYPDAYNFLIEKLDVQRDARMVLVKRLADELSAQLHDLNLQFEIKGRPKHFYSIYKKMTNQGKTFEEIYDLVAVRVIVENIGDCYTVLGIIHSMWKPVPGRFKDYIASPKPNMYQSLHTTIMTNFGQVFEIQIRTQEMNKVAEYGIAAHWKYKEGKNEKSNETELDKKLSWVKEVMDVQGDLKDSLEFIDTLKMNTSTNEIFVFTPKGSVFDMPVGSTCIDFAYRVHSEVGNKCVGVKVNNKITPVNTVLENGDVVEVLTSNASKGPSRDWIKFAITPTAKAKIRSFFKKTMKEENIKRGRQMLEEEAKRKGYNLGEIMLPSSMKLIMDRYNYSEVEEMYASIGYGGIKTNQILFKLIDYYKKSRIREDIIDLIDNDGKQKEISKKRSTSGIIIDGYDDFLIRIARCCNPVPGDKIIGYVSRGRGVAVHKADCPNMKNVEKERIMNAKWADADNSVFIAPINIECDTKNSLITQITGTIAKMSLNIATLNARQNKQKDKMQITIGLEIKSTSDIDAAIKKLNGIKGVFKVERGQ